MYRLSCRFTLHSRIKEQLSRIVLSFVGKEVDKRGKYKNELFEKQTNFEIKRQGHDQI